jgi:lipopolysaccharide transport system ATP-binding protein
MSTVIQIQNISKAYQLGQLGTGTISRDLERWWASIRGKEDPYLKIGEENDRTVKSTNNIVWSLKNINFEIQQGDAIGIVGRNGAGKSTLLKLLSRVTSPTTGTIKAKGRIASLLEVGTGFHPELSGKENIYLNGAILGMRKKEIDRKLDQIIDFSGVEKYVDTPVKRYSSGMYVRLAFAVAAHLDAEILIVDEVLAVGDAEFQKKCLGKMKDVSAGEGKTVLFVSHNMAAIANLCNKGIVLNNGLLGFEGNVQDTLKYYMQSTVHIGSHYKNTNDLKKDKVEEVIILKEGKKNANAFYFEDQITLSISVSLQAKIAGTHIGFAILDKWHQKIFTDTYVISEASLAQEFCTVEVSLPSKLLLAGVYFVDVALFVPKLNNFDYVSDACTFEIEDIHSHLSIFNGAEIGNIMMKCNWKQL